MMAVVPASAASSRAKWLAIIQSSLVALVQSGNVLAARGVALP
jgi:hypothetical protein